MNKYILCISVLLSLGLAGCGSETISEPTGSSLVSAPISISGKSIKGSITSGTGAFAAKGRSTFVASNTDNTYKVLGDGKNSINSNGTFVYSANHNIATLMFDDSVIGKGKYSFTFTSNTKGTYIATVELSPEANQTGSFEVLKSF